MEIKAHHTVSKIITWLAIAMVASLVLLWLWGGGLQKIISKARELQFSSFSDLLDPTKGFGNFKLPWQIDMPVVSVGSVQNIDGSYSDGSSAPPGMGSSHVGAVTIVQGAARTQSPQGQYIEVRSTGGSVSISGWSLESAISGQRVYIPQATPLFIMGRINAVSDVVLAPGGRAIIVTGPSPVGVSFQENKCTGYLGTLQPFVPALSTQCPSPTVVIARTAESEARLGASCFQYLSQLSPCTFPQNPPASLTAACRAEIQNKLSYNGCVNQYKDTSGFASGSWRVYLALGSPLWGVQHDIIRLLDENGAVVNALNY